MNQITKLKLRRMKGSGQLQPAAGPLMVGSENKLTPVTVSGVLAPCTDFPSHGGTSEYKLISHSGLEYFIVADDRWREVLTTYCWEEVNVVGLLNVSNMTLIPQKVYPKGPTGENVIDMASWKSKEIVQKLVKNVDDLLVTPTAAWAMMAA